MTDSITGSYFLRKKSNESRMRMQRKKVSAYLRAKGGWLVIFSNFAYALFYLNLAFVEKITFVFFTCFEETSCLTFN